MPQDSILIFSMVLGGRAEIHNLRNEMRPTEYILAVRPLDFTQAITLNSHRSPKADTR